ncbi:MAG TPA: hypothetical protein VND68_05135, partial [Chloroflexia bacterium]|jgi:hypothetical protein|nr:hypothetical protein [Chloroflexia bacterium]
VPTKILSLVLSVIPCIGIVTLVLPFFQVYCAGQSMRASQRLEPGKAMLAAFIPAIVIVLLVCGCFVFAVTSALSQVGR